MFERLEHKGRFIGYTFENEYAHFVFGSRFLHKDELHERFPQYRFAFLKQVHGAHVIRADAAQLSEADGHFTSEPGLALVSQTADCIPILLARPGHACALHAGWRGVAGRIVSASRLAWREDPQTIAFGPHITRESFEVGADVANTLLSAVTSPVTNEHVVAAHSEPGKVFVDLGALVRRQFSETYPNAKVLECRRNTVTDPEFHSFRRDRAQAGRQYSFVVLKA